MYKFCRIERETIKKGDIEEGKEREKREKRERRREKS